MASTNVGAKPRPLRDTVTPMTPHMPRLWTIALRFGIYFAFAWGAVTWRRWQKRRQESLAQSWPSVEGIVLTGTVSPVPKTSCFLATLQYTYFVGEYHTGTYFHEFARESEADAFVRKLNNKRLSIRYDPTKAEQSVLEQAVAEQAVAEPQAQLAPHFG